MHESLMLFESILALDAFRKSTFILFLTKTDILRKKLCKRNISRYFPDYNHRDDLNEDYYSTRSYFASKFCNLNNNSHRQIHVHYVNTTDCSQMKSCLDKTLELSRKAFAVGPGPTRLYLGSRLSPCGCHDEPKHDSNNEIRDESLQ